MKPNENDAHLMTKTVIILNWPVGSFMIHLFLA